MTIMSQLFYYYGDWSKETSRDFVTRHTTVERIALIFPISIFVHEVNQMNTMPQTMLTTTRPSRKQISELTDKTTIPTIIIVQNGCIDALEDDIHRTTNIFHADDIHKGIEYAERFQADALILINSSTEDEQLLQRILAREPLLQNTTYVCFSSIDMITKQIIDLL